MGIFLRQKLYPYFLGKCGSKVLVGRFVNFGNPAHIYLGDNVIIGDKVTLDAGGGEGMGGAINLADMVFVGTGSCLDTASGEAKITLQAGSSIGSFCDVKTTGAVRIGEDVLLAAYCKVGHGCSEGEEGLQEQRNGGGSISGDIDIESGCWLGVRSRVLPGVVVGEGTIVGAHAVVEKDLPSYVIAVGDPAKVLRRRPDSALQPSQ